LQLINLSMTRSLKIRQFTNIGKQIHMKNVDRD